MIRQLQEKILKLKEERDFYILAHSYQAKEITEIADFVGDSFQLSLNAAECNNKNILMCGVHFMAETVKMLSYDKNVYLANQLAGCPMAEQVEPEMLEYIKKNHEGYTVVAYINTTAALKELCDVCVTSSTAVKIVQRIENNNILFIPDCNLGNYVKENVKGKNIKLIQGGCPVHAAVTKKDLENAKALHPDALVLVHPECVPDVVAGADYVGSTSGIVEFAKKSDAKEFIIGTEMSIAEHLQYACPEKDFYILSKKILCPNMKLTTLVDVYKAIDGRGGKEIKLDKDKAERAKKCIDEMIRLGK
ncbi:MAG: quinolinate synthase NadA [Firmicutes bacterium]|nr:quinolinate synthase NadA [Bacillota bacterium]